MIIFEGTDTFTNLKITVMKRIIYALIAVMLVTSCGQSEAEKKADAAQRDYLKTMLLTTNKLIDVYNEDAGILSIPEEAKFDIEHYNNIIDQSKGKKLKELATDLQGRVDMLRESME